MVESRCPLCHAALSDGGHACSTVPADPEQVPIRPQHLSVGHDGSVWVVLPSGKGYRAPFVIDGRKAKRQG